MTVLELIELRLRRIVQRDLIALPDVDASYARAMTRAHDFVERAIDELCTYNESDEAKAEQQETQAQREERFRQISEYMRSFAR